jgi:sporulation protein YlmC with PRC-barrel domain
MAQSHNFPVHSWTVLIGDDPHNPNLKTIRRFELNTTIFPNVLSSSSICSDHVKNEAGEDLGEIEDLMIDLHSGRIAYAVLSFGGFLKMGNKLFAIPWEALKVDAVNKVFILHVDKARLENATGFDKDNWPNMADPAFGSTLYRHYGYKPYWEDAA